LKAYINFAKIFGCDGYYQEMSDDFWIMYV
jgi:hypothetical protein